MKTIENEKGIAFVMVLILSFISLATMAGLVYMITSGTQISGMQKRYSTATEAGKAGSEIAYQLVSTRGNTAGTNFYTNLAQIFPNPDASGNPPSFYEPPATCTGTDIYGFVHTGLAAKLNAPFSTWSANCDSSLTIVTGNTATFDMRFDFGTYRLYSKIADTVEGNTGPDLGLVKTGVVPSRGEDWGKRISFLYTLELHSEDPNTPAERSKLSVLYKY